MTSQRVEDHLTRSQPRCGCCGRVRPANRLTRLGSTPGVFICAGCAFWATRQTVGLPDPRHVTGGVAAVISRLLPGRAHAHNADVESLTPILLSSDPGPQHSVLEPARVRCRRAR